MNEGIIVLARDIKYNNALHKLEVLVKTINNSQNIYMNTSMKSYKNFKLKKSSESNLIMPLIEEIDTNSIKDLIYSNEVYENAIVGSEFIFTEYLRKKFGLNKKHRYRENHIELNNTNLNILYERWYPKTDLEKVMMIGTMNVEGRKSKQTVFLNLTEHGIIFDESYHRKNDDYIDILADKAERIKEQLESKLDFKKTG